MPSLLRVRPKIESCRDRRHPALACREEIGLAIGPRVEISLEPQSDRSVKYHRLLVAVLRVHDGGFFRFPIDVVLVERQGFRDSHAGCKEHFAERPRPETRAVS